MNSIENIALSNQKSYLAINYCTKPHFPLNTHSLLCIRGNESLKVLVQLRRVISRKTWSLNLNNPNKFGPCCNLSQRSNYLIQSLLVVNWPANFIYILSSLKTQLRFKTHTNIHTVWKLNCDFKPIHNLIYHIGVCGPKDAHTVIWG